MRLGTLTLISLKVTKMQNAQLLNFEKYSETVVFNEKTMPDALKREHCTKTGVWGQIIVCDGTLLYLREDRPAQVVTKEHPAIIYPTERHSVQPKGRVQFRVEFFRDPNASGGEHA